MARVLIVAAGLVLIGQAASLVAVLAANVDTQPVIAAGDNDGGVAISVAIGTKLYDDNGWRPYGPLYYRLVRIMSGGAAKDGVPEAGGLDQADVGAKTRGVQADALAAALASEKASERRHHFLLMLVSLVSLYGLAWLLACLISCSLLWRLILTPLLVAVLSSHPTWAQMVLRPHPDHLFALLIAIAVWRTVLWLDLEARASGIEVSSSAVATFRNWAAAAWGLAAATKLSVLPFGLGGAFLFLTKRPGLRVQWNWREALRFVGVAFGVYLIVSFPQGFNFLGVFEFLGQQSTRNFRPPDGESVRRWAELFWSHGSWPVIGVAVLAAVVPRGRGRWHTAECSAAATVVPGGSSGSHEHANDATATNASASGRASAPPKPAALGGGALTSRALALGLALILAPVIYLFGKKVLSPIDWYPLPFVAAALVWTALVVQSVRTVLSGWAVRAGVGVLMKASSRWLRVKQTGSLLVVVIALSGWSWLIPAIPASWASELQALLQCRAEAQKAETLANQAALESRGVRGAVLADPLSPYARLFHDREVEMRWEMTLAAIRPETRTLALRSTYHSQYLAVEEGGQGGAAVHIKDLEAVRLFYRLFWKRAEAETPDGRRWLKVHDDACGFEIWRAQPAS
jgi:hypothetical protein